MSLGQEKKDDLSNIEESITKKTVDRCLAVYDNSGKDKEAAAGRKCSYSKKKLSLRLLPQISDDILSEEILTKLPLTSMCICKCVSKSWNSLIMHNFHHRSQRSPIICTIGFGTSTVRFCSIDLNTGAGIVNPNSYNPIDIGGDLLFEPICYNGFIHCFSFDEIERLLVFNPATQQKIILPNTHRHRVDFGFDPCSNKFKFFGWMKYPQCEIYTVEKNSSWRKLTSTPIQGSGKFSSKPFCLNGTMYWYSDTQMIISFNLATETFGLIQGPNTDIKKAACLFEFEACLCVAMIDHIQEIMNLWMLKDHGKVDSRWVRIARVNKPLGTRIYWRTPYPVRPGEIILACTETKGSQSFYLYSFFTRQFQNIKICGPDVYFILDNFVENPASLKDL